MPPIQGPEDHCKTADDVLAAARAVIARRRLMAPSAPPRITPKAAPVVAPIVPAAPPEPPKPLPPEIARPLSGIVFPPQLLEDDKVSVATIQRLVCRVFDIRHEDLCGPCRTPHLVVPRHIAMILCKMKTDRSLPDIGRRFGNRDHTTVLHAIRKYQWLMDKLYAEVSPLATLLEVVQAAKRLLEAGKPA